MTTKYILEAYNIGVYGNYSHEIFRFFILYNTPSGRQLGAKKKKLIFKKKVDIGNE